MLKQASVKQVKDCLFARDLSHIVITMRFYPRFLKKALRDEFICALAPEKELLRDFNKAQKELGDHNSSFQHVDYENRFELTQTGWDHLKRLSDLSTTRDVYLVCICNPGDRCHREILLLTAKQLYGCEVGEVFHTYPDFMRNLNR